MRFPSLAVYWAQYGGLSALLSSPYWWFSAIFTLAVNFMASSQELVAFRSVQISLLPSMLAFSLGAFTVLLVVPVNGGMRQVWGVGERESFYMKVVAAMFHFIVVQFFALIFAIFGFFVELSAWDLITVLLTVYAMTCGMATAVILLGLARIRNASRE